jgi:hypothetical protein
MMLKLVFLGQHQTWMMPLEATSSLPIHRKKASLSLKDTHYMDNLPKRLVLSSGLTSPFFLLVCYYEMYKGEE